MGSEGRELRRAEALTALTCVDPPAFRPSEPLPPPSSPRPPNFQTGLGAVSLPPSQPVLLEPCALWFLLQTFAGIPRPHQIHRPLGSLRPLQSCHHSVHFDTRSVGGVGERQPTEHSPRATATSCAAPGRPLSLSELPSL